MNRIYTLGLILLCTVLTVAVKAQSFDRKAFYTAMAANKSAVIDAQIQAVQSSKVTEKEAFVGALLMRKAGTLGNASQKLSVFKSGNKKLESGISSQPTNAELRFLRLMIQEHAPKILGYNKNIQEDAKSVKNNYTDLPKVTQQAILLYSKTSNALAGLPQL